MNTPVDRTLLNIYVSGDIIKGVLAFKILSHISSYPCEVLFLWELIILFISYVVVLYSFIWEWNVTSDLIIKYILPHFYLYVVIGFVM